jgi:hypothetical protein
MKQRSKKRYWSGGVTRNSNALDLQPKIFSEKDPNRNCAFAEAFDGNQPKAQSQPV